jgi:hypothetical protein
MGRHSKQAPARSREDKHSAGVKTAIYSIVILSLVFMNVKMKNAEIEFCFRGNNFLE